MVYIYFNIFVVCERGNGIHYIIITEKGSCRKGEEYQRKLNRYFGLQGRHPAHYWGVRGRGRVIYIFN